MDPISLINKAIEAAERLKSFSDTITDAKIRLLFSELYSSLTDSKIEIARLKSKNQELEEEIARLKTEEFATKPKISSGCYQFENDTALYCISCYELNKRKSPSFSWENVAMICSVCGKDTPL